MLALNRTTIDFFSLDVEGDELKILKTIPFDKINIKMLTVEYLHGPGGANALQKFMESKGYQVVANIRQGYSVGDLIFIKKGLYNNSLSFNMRSCIHQGDKFHSTMTSLYF